MTGASGEAASHVPWEVMCWHSKTFLESNLAIYLRNAQKSFLSNYIFSNYPWQILSEMEANVYV